MTFPSTSGHLLEKHILGKPKKWIQKEVYLKLVLEYLFLPFISSNIMSALSKFYDPINYSPLLLLIVEDALKNILSHVLDLNKPLDVPDPWHHALKNLCSYVFLCEQFTNRYIFETHIWFIQIFIFYTHHSCFFFLEQLQLFPIWVLKSFSIVAFNKAP